MAASSGPAQWAYRAFRALPSPVRGLGDAALRLRAERAARALPAFPEEPTRLLIGPLNTAGQAHRWAQAARQVPGVAAKSLNVERRSTGVSYGYETDWFLSRKVQLRGMRPYQERVLGLTHVLAESGRAVLDHPLDRTIIEDLPRLRAAGVDVGLLIHGSELRDLREHAEAYPHSPFQGEWDERWRRMQATVERTRAVVEQFDGELFVPTHDMLDFVPGAALLPIVVDVDRFTVGPGNPGVQALEREQPVVLHAPTNPRLKGTDAIERVLHRLEGEGLVAYRRLQGIPNAQMPTFLQDADVVIDQIVLGNAATLTAEATAAGRLVIGHLSPGVRDRMTAFDPGGHEPPIVEADPDTLEEVLRQILGDRSTYQEIAAQGPAWARRNHDGTRAASVLAAWFKSPQSLG
ncbi:hypothetical protein [Ornithinimicrobium cryptoxanthini]|uniref:Uncharacterized protein n=1 Tax=Ornithinimicrobium cryptoxanthini TaxID=2934161 RepID=A0ABY4YLU0_9MICO|nr:hypothetical protein [Ornithinimicrobium cryptoxanthini]USQ77678.1 hypothetical protein NF557_07195 [Ornithinimicrobium cryptoxanthini]